MTMRRMALRTGRFLLGLLLAAGLPPVTAAADLRPVRVMTFNILVDLPNAAFEPWSARRTAIIDTIRRHDPDLLSLQETAYWQVADLRRQLTAHEFFYAPQYPDAVIAYRTARFAPRAQNWEWIGPHPELPVGIGYGNLIPRLYVWSILAEKASGRELLFSATHFDSTKPFQQRAAQEYIRNLEARSSGRPVIAAGDFNSRPASVAYGLLTAPLPSGFQLRDSWDVAATRSVVQPPEDSRVHDPARRIDHVLVSREFAVDAWTVDMTRYGDPLRDPSDHYAVVAALRLAEPPAATAATPVP